MKLLIALGGNALLRRGQALSAENQLENIRRVAGTLARVALHHELVITHGNGPQVGLLALQNAAYEAVEPYPLDVLDAQTQGMIGYLLEQELANRLPPGRTVATLLTRVEVDIHDPAFNAPSKPVGPVYTEEEARRLAGLREWAMTRESSGYRRAVASPHPVRVLGLDPVRWLLEHGAVVIAAGGGGIPVARSTDGSGMHGVEAVIDKDLCSAMLAQEINADALVIATDVDAVYLDWGKPASRPVGRVAPQALHEHGFEAGSMQPKVEAACGFVVNTGRDAMIGSLEQIEEMLAGRAGTRITPDGARQA